jgi:hypothetical protein
MKVKPVDPNAVIRDPHTKQPLPAEGGDVPENNFWTRRCSPAKVVRESTNAVMPTGREPVAPLTTRGGK